MNDPKGFVLTQTDRDTLEDVIEAVLGERQNRGSITEQRSKFGAPETYLAFTGSGGIPGAVESIYTGTGTVAEVGAPGSAECDLWTIEGYGADAVFRQIPGLDRRVYNVNTTAVPANTWVVVTRTKGGSWVVTGNVASASASVVGPIHVVDGTGTGSGDWYCQAVQLSGSSWVVSPGPTNYTNVVEINGLTPRHLDTAATAGAAALAVTVLYQDVNGRYFIDYPLLSDSAVQTFTTPLTWTTVCNSDGTFTTTPATYQTVTITVAWDNWSDFPRVNLTLTVS